VWCGDLLAVSSRDCGGLWADWPMAYGHIQGDAAHQEVRGEGGLVDVGRGLG
jgi:hypothetical protein